jgi:protein TonB
LASGIPALRAQDDKVYKVGEPGVVAPKLKHSVQPGYTAEAQAHGIVGEVGIAFEIDKEGKTRNVKVVAGLDPGLDKNAVAAVTEWLFDPATKDGRPVVCEAKTQVKFRLQ